MLYAMAAETTTQPPETRQYMTARQVEAMLDVERGTLKRLVAEEGFPVIRLTPRIHRYDLAAVYAWIDSRWSNRDAGSAA